MSDPMIRPQHYAKHPSGVECITIVQELSFNLGCAFKYLWRMNDKGNKIQDMEKAIQYIKFERDRLLLREGADPCYKFSPEFLVAFDTWSRFAEPSWRVQNVMTSIATFDLMGKPPVQLQWMRVTLEQLIRQAKIDG